MSIFSSDRKFVTTLEIKIDKDGTISSVAIVKSSGNVVMDDSVLAAAKRVKKIAPLPADLSASPPYAIRINFELDQN
jgi:TonB family protein